MTQEEIERGKSVAALLNLFAKECEELDQGGKVRHYRSMYHGAIIAIRACRGDEFTEAMLREEFDQPNPDKCTR